LLAIPVRCSCSPSSLSLFSSVSSSRARLSKPSRTDAAPGQATVWSVVSSSNTSSSTTFTALRIDCWAWSFLRAVAGSGARRQSQRRSRHYANPECSSPKSPGRDASSYQGAQALIRAEQLSRRGSGPTRGFEQITGIQGDQVRRCCTSATLYGGILRLHRQRMWRTACTSRYATHLLLRINAIVSSRQRVDPSVVFFSAPTWARGAPTAPRGTNHSHCTTWARVCR
jgi:hypothetical protein